MMSNVDIRKAIDEVRDLSGDVTDCLSGGLTWDTFTYRGSLLSQLLDAAIVLQRSCIEHLKEVDDRPVTEQWLREVGFSERHQHDIDRGGLAKKHPNGAPSLLWGNKPHHVVTRWYLVENHTSVEIQDLDSRGEVRKLCAALGIELKEKK